MRYVKFHHWCKAGILPVSTRTAPQSESSSPMEIIHSNTGKGFAGILPVNPFSPLIEDGNQAIVNLLELDAYPGSCIG